MDSGDNAISVYLNELYNNQLIKYSTHGEIQVMKESLGVFEELHLLFPLCFVRD